MSRGRSDRAYEIGYGRPPASGRFRPGRSGNPRGQGKRRGERDRGDKPPYEAVLGQKVIVREDGVERRLTAAEAFLLHMTKSGLDGDSGAARLAMAAIEQARDAAPEAKYQIETVWTCDSPDSVNQALRPLRMAVKLDPYEDTARMMLEPWLVQAALKRLGERRLTVREQRVVVEATLTPRKVRWPVWWAVRC